MKDFISIRDIDKETFESLFKRTKEMEKILKSGTSEFQNKIIALLFFEPSTRTKLSFQSAAIRLGAHTIDFGLLEATSVAKGENFTDTVRIVDGYADLIVVRHPMEGSARLAAQIAEHPIINAGDGGNQHPTQTLIDLYTIKKTKNRLDVDVCLLGDLKHARTMRSLIYGLGMFGANITLTSPKGLEMDKNVIREVKEKFSVSIKETNKIQLSEFDVVYVCRIQKERFADQYEAEKLQKEFQIKLEDLENAREELIILHPLPKIDEIDSRIDRTKHALYFEQARNGIPVRMAVISELLCKVS